MSDEEKEPRKVSDIILSLEEKVNTLTKIVSVYDMNTKIILDRVNKIYAYIEMLQREMAAEQLPASSGFVEEPAVIQTSVENVLQEADSPPARGRAGRSESYTSPEVLPAIQEAPAPKMARQDNDRKIPVLQRVTLAGPDGAKDMYMAEVTILNDQRELVVKTKTNAAGKWQAYLKPGIYSIGIIKTDTATKKKIEAMQDNVHVADSNTTVILPTAVIKRPV